MSSYSDCCFQIRIFPLHNHRRGIATKPRELIYKQCMSNVSDDSNIEENRKDSIKLHHTAIRTRNIETAIQFYSLFGFDVEERFRSGPAKCCWLSSFDSSAKLELIEIPPFILNEEAGTRKRALDLFHNEQMLGLNHVAIDVTTRIQQVLGPIITVANPMNALEIRSYGLREYIHHVNQTSVENFGKGLRLAMQPRQQIVGRHVYELAFLYDADGAMLELLNLIKVLDTAVDCGWEPWRGAL